MANTSQHSTSSLVFKATLFFAALFLLACFFKNYFLERGLIMAYAGLLAFLYFAFFVLFIWSIVYWVKRKKIVKRPSLPFFLTLSVLIISILLSPIARYFSYDKNEGFISKLYLPRNIPGKVPAIICLSGSEGGIFVPNLMADGYRRRGYVALAVAYFKCDGLPDYLESIPLEYFERAFNIIRNEPMVDTNKIIIVGASKGAELALLLASKYPAVKGVIAIAPSCYVFEGIPSHYSTAINSSWLQYGKPVPFIPYKMNENFRNSHHYADLYNATIAQPEYRDSATIKVENINGPVLLISGDDDLMWPSNFMSEQIINRLNDHHFGFFHKHLNYKNAGHAFMLTSLGGTSEGNKAASNDSKSQIDDFLKNKLR